MENNNKNINFNSVINPINNMRGGYPPSYDAFYQYPKKFKTCDGKDVATMEEVMQYNQMFYERMKKRVEVKPIENKRRSL